MGTEAYGHVENTVNSDLNVHNKKISYAKLQ